MPIIKRYPNRKLYDTEAKKYVTLNGIAALIRQGEDVQVVDHKTEEDLTAVTLTQIIFEQEKKKGGFLPKSVLTGLVQAGGDTLNVLRRSLTSPLDMFHHVDDEIEKRVQSLISRGDLAKEEGFRLRDKLLSFGNNTPTKSNLNDEQLLALLHQHGVPTRDEIDHLNDQLETLTNQLEDILTTRLGE